MENIEYKNKKEYNINLRGKGGYYLCIKKEKLC